ncbi:clp1-like protein [Schizophyllum commune Tattone D]|nr:clp1-like protein [Schizophyllum commune Tattone D]
MFQVASHPSSFATHGHGHHHSHHSSSHHSSAHGSHGVNLPRTLQRPQFYDIPSRNIAAVAPDLAGVPIEYVRRGLYPRAREMIGGISTLNVPSTMPANHLPKHLNVGCRATPGVSYPTHLLAVCASKSGDAHAKLVPTHALVLAAHCAHVEPLDAAAPQPGGSVLPLRVVRMAVPSPAAFPILHAYMYNHRADAVAQALFPALPAGAARAFATHQGITAALGSGQAKHQLAAQLMQAEGGNLSRLTADAAHVKEAWQDMVSLGMYDAQLWDTIDLCWEVVLAALNLAAAQQ